MTTDAIQEAIQIGIRFDRYLQRACDLSLQLMGKIGNSDIGSVASILEERARVCEEIKRCSNQLQSIAKRLPPRCQDGITKHPNLEQIIEQVSNGLKSLMEKQTACEDALHALLGEYRRNLARLRQHHSLIKTYEKQPQMQSSRFLDNML